MKENCSRSSMAAATLSWSGHAPATWSITGSANEAQIARKLGQKLTYRTAGLSSGEIAGRRAGMFDSSIQKKPPLKQQAFSGSNRGLKQASEVDLGSSISPWLGGQTRERVVAERPKSARSTRISASAESTAQDQQVGGPILPALFCLI